MTAASVRVHQGLLPACVKACLFGALKLVDLEAPEEQIRKEHSPAYDQYADAEGPGIGRDGSSRKENKKDGSKSVEYDEYPGLTEEVEGQSISRPPETSREFTIGMIFRMQKWDGHKLVLQILEPYTRNEPEKLHPCFVFRRGLPGAYRTA